MKFKDIYVNSKKAVIDTLDAMWCSEVINGHNDSGVEGFSSQLQAQASEIYDKLEELMFPKDAIPLIQYSEMYLGADGEGGRVDRETAEALVMDADGNSLWNKKDFYFGPSQGNDGYRRVIIGEGESFSASHQCGQVENPHPPYLHQYKSWRALSEQVILDDGTSAKKSMVVTTGTGSGKTECFMLPLVSNLLLGDDENGGESGRLQAIFLYPLNALMEDQKERLQELLSGTNLHFCVYNGNLPEKADERNYREIKEEVKRYPNICPTRRALRGLPEDVTADNGRRTLSTFEWQPADIILTNPTMLEYMLLRKADQSMIRNANLKWVVIDETHTYTGAAATELAMLMRRVLLAFEKTPNDIRFATSSATIGNASDKSNERKLKQFIMGITGQSDEQITIVKGDKKTLVENTVLRATIGNDEELQKAYSILSEKEFVSLEEFDEVYNAPPFNDVESRLEKLDTLCDRGLPVKTHFFSKVLTQGLRVRLDKFNKKTGVFEVFSNEPVGNEIPYLELKKCEKCGGYIAVGEEGNGEDTYRRISVKDDDMFDFGGSEESRKPLFYGLCKGGLSLIPSQRYVSVHGGNRVAVIEVSDDEYGVVENRRALCPYCGESLSSRTNDNQTEQQENDVDDKKLQSFRLSSTFMSRLMAPALLNQMQSFTPRENDTPLPHDGQQYLSFVDSRQAASRATLRQTVEVERQWVYSKIFHELCRRNNENEDIKYISWEGILDLLSNDPISDALCLQSLDRENRDDIDNGRPSFYTKTNYLLGLMFESLAKRPISAASPENMGLFTSCYPQLENIQESPCPDIFSLEEWKHLLKVYLDRDIRTNYHVFLKYEQQYDNVTKRFDLNGFRRFITKKYNARLAEKDNGATKSNYSIIDKLIVASLLRTGGNVSNQQVGDYVRNHNEDYARIHRLLWESLVDYRLLQVSQRIGNNGWEDDDNNCYEEHDDGTRELVKGRMNLMHLSFKLYEDVYFCNTSKSDSRSVFRPYDTLVNGYAPFSTINGVVKVNIDEDYERWRPFNFGEVVDGDVLNWAREQRSKMFDYKLWGEKGDHGCFSNRLTEIYKGYRPFIQAEHTAQVDKGTAKLSQEMFKNHEVNILACSTTMEMGVNLGDLELVMMNSVPPHPANYKQRAGRSGRGGQCRSVSITLCGSDSIGIRTLHNPLKEIIYRKTAVPFVDLKSDPVVLRHINAFLLRKFLSENRILNDDNMITDGVIDFFSDSDTPYKVQKVGNRYRVVVETENGIQYKNPNDKFCNPNNDDDYSKFITKIQNYNADAIPDSLVSDSNFESGDSKQGAINNTRNCITAIHDKLSVLFDELNGSYNDATNTGSEKKKIAVDREWTKVHGQNLIEFFTKERFIPNANMPINVVELDVNRDSNPSYQLRESLSQYAPGNSLVLSNQVKVVRGIQWTGQYIKQSGLKYLFSNGNKVKINSNPDSHPFDGDEIRWNVNDKIALPFLPPVKFSVSVEDEDSRIENRNRYTEVNAQLIGVDDWTADGNHLYGLRTNAELQPDETNGRIFYYNQGIGFGYCICKTCGKAILELEKERYPRVGVPGEGNVPPGFYEPSQNINDQQRHKHILGWGDHCYGKPWRNVVIGDCIQTDFTEIKIRMTEMAEWMERRDDSKNLLTTLGVVFVRVLTEYLGKESKDVDFIVMSNGHLCIFDTNPGGSGYSNQLGGANSIMDIIIDKSEELLNNVESKDELLDKFSLRYFDKIDVDAALKWIHNEQRYRPQPPQDVTDVYSTALKTDFASLLEDLFENGNSQIFVNDDFQKWNYDEPGSGANWRNRILRVRNREGNIPLNIVTQKENNYPVIAYRVFERIQDWCILYRAQSPLESGFYPLAISNRMIYFTTQKDYACMDENWAKSEALYRMPIDNRNDLEQDALDTCRPDKLKKFIITNPIGRRIKTDSKHLVEIVCESDEIANGIIDSFLNYCDDNPDNTLDITYQDEHLKSPAGIITTVQFIDWFINRINPENANVKFLLEKYYTQNECFDPFDDNPDMSRMGLNMTNDNRDDFFNKILDSWYEENESIQGCYLNNVRRGDLPHWRVLRFEYAGAILELYPNGGIINGWNVDQDNNQIPIPENFDNWWKTEVPLYMRDNEIMYDVLVELPD